MSVKRWVLPSLDKEIAAQLAEDCEIHPFLALMLVTRGITDAESAAEFLLCSECTDDPYSFADMDAAVDRLLQAIDRQEMMAVYGDYDADGVTATVLLYSYLREKSPHVVYYIPDREGEGYGLHKDSIDSLHRQGVKLIVTVDNGISAVEEIAYATELGIDVVVTDHHQPPAVLPKAVAVVNPHRADCGSSFKDYAGVGVAFKLVCAMEGDTDSMLEQYADLVALGTLGDVMPLCGENRALVRAGLRMMNQTCRPGIAQLRKVAGVDGKVLNSTTAVFSLVPRLNAAGRMDTPDLAARLLLTTQDVVAEQMAAQIQECNVTRQSMENHIFLEIKQRLVDDPQLLSDRVLVLEGENWHAGVVGILAARLVERYGKPCVLIAIKDGEGKGSGRSVPGFSLYEAVSSCSHLLSRFGGHELAAGLSLAAENVAEFRRAVNDYAQAHYPDMPVPELAMDFKIRPSQVDVEKLNLIAALEPMGAGNPVPVFGLYGMRLDNVTPLSQGKHVRLSVSRDNVRLSVVKFNMTYDSFPFECGQMLNLVVTLERNEYRGVVTPTLLLKDMRSADLQQEELIQAQRAFDCVIRGENIPAEMMTDWCPARTHLENTYRFLRNKKNWTGPLDQLCYFMQDTTISYIQMRLTLEILRQAGLISLIDHGDSLEILLLPVNSAGGKADLTATPVWKYLHAGQPRQSQASK